MLASFISIRRLWCAHLFSQYTAVYAENKAKIQTRDMLHLQRQARFSPTPARADCQPWATRRHRINGLFLFVYYACIRV